MILPKDQRHHNLLWRFTDLYKAQKVQKYALNSQLQALQILTNDDEVEN